ncbi:MAG: permease, partial [Alphaproteobacteria bacterium]
MSELIANFRQTLPIRLKELAQKQTFMKDRVLWTIALIYLVLYVLAPERVLPSLKSVSASLIELLPYLLVSVFLAAAIKVSNADQLIAKVFARSQASGVVAASLFGALSPFCSCGVIPIIAGLLAAGVPLAPVMAFMIASPLMDPEMFVISTGLLGIEFTMARTLGAIFAGLVSGFIVMAVQKRPAFADPLREASKPVSSCCGGGKSTTST